MSEKLGNAVALRDRSEARSKVTPSFVSPTVRISNLTVACVRRPKTNLPLTAVCAVWCFKCAKFAGTTINRQTTNDSRSIDRTRVTVPADESARAYRVLTLGCQTGFAEKHEELTLPKRSWVGTPLRGMKVSYRQRTPRVQRKRDVMEVWHPALWLQAR